MQKKPLKELLQELERELTRLGYTEGSMKFYRNRYIRDFLGHEDIKTTEIYAKCDTQLKRQAIENAYPSLIDSNLPDWNKDAALLDWLSSLK